MGGVWYFLDLQQIVVESRYSLDRAEASVKIAVKALRRCRRCNDEDAAGSGCRRRSRTNRSRQRCRVSQDSQVLDHLSAMHRSLSLSHRLRRAATFAELETAVYSPMHYSKDPKRQ